MAKMFHKKVSNILSHQGNAYENYFEIPSLSSQDGRHPENKWQ